ncbi:MAG TPA: HNH endonuclease [Micromonosporaceae bacterium]
MGTGWHGSNRRAELPPDWPAIRARIWARDHGRCQWPTDTGPCHWPGRDVDHRADPHDHSDTNLWVLCGWHHDRKTAAEGNAARRRFSTKRPPEPHPGLL